MPSPNHPILGSPVTDAVIRMPDPAARKAGMLLLLTALASVIAIAGRVGAGADQPTLVESLAAISDNRDLYGTGGAGRFVSGIALIAAACFLSRTWIIRERLGTPFVPVLFFASGMFTSVSGACAVLLATSVPDSLNALDASIEATAFVRWFAGKIGFAAAGIALIVAARYQWRVGGALRRVSPVTAIQGIAMQFIWIDSATIAHPIIGATFFVWLISIGGMLMTGRVERHFRDMLGRASKHGK